VRPRRRLLLLAVVVCLIIIVGYLTAQRPKSVRGWGMLIDLDNDCTVKEEGSKLTITIPGGTHDLNMTLGGMNAPRVLREVDGDFTVQAKVSGEFDPGDEAAKHDIAPFNSAGLLLWQDEKNYLRLERNGWWSIEDKTIACYAPLIEYYIDGQHRKIRQKVESADFFKSPSTWLKLERQDGKVTAFYSHDGQEWMTAKEIVVEFPPKIKVGVAAVNTSKKPFTVEFEEFQLDFP
jgi:regulation of enolase protein 1 (concanavalin A-like superfamily)